MPEPTILAFAGSARQDSFNKRLVRVAVEQLRAAGGTVTLIDLRDYPMPLYDGDLESSAGLPAAAVSMYELMTQHQGFLLACPEYNSSITPLLKNTIDWVSRPRAGEAPLAAFTGKTAALLAASPGALGGLRGLVHVRSILSSIGVHVIPGQVAVPQAHEAFAEDGTLSDQRTASRIADVCRSLVDVTRKLNAP